MLSQHMSYMTTELYRDTKLTMELFHDMLWPFKMLPQSLRFRSLEIGSTNQVAVTEDNLQSVEMDESFGQLQTVNLQELSVGLRNSNVGQRECVPNGPSFP